MMPRLLVGLGVAAAVFWVYTLVDCMLFDKQRTRGLPKLAWVFIVLLIPVIGGLLWLLVGRARRQGGSRTRTVAPDDDPEFLGSLGRDAAQEERIRRLEQELAELDGDADTGPAPGETPRVDPHDSDHRTDGDKPGRTDA